MTSYDRVYISGPMTGLSRQHYIQRFQLAERMLRAKGYQHIVNPIHVWSCRFTWLYKIFGYRITLLYDLWLLMHCQRIYKMPGWQQSRGAQIESCVAYNLEILLLAKPIRIEIDEEINNLIKKQV